MNKNPYLNAVGAAAYIVLLVSGMFSAQGLHIEEPNMLIPMTMLSLLVLSVAVMGYFFAMQPIMMYIDGKKKQAVDFFGKTLVTFGGICVLFIIGLLLMSTPR